MQRWYIAAGVEVEQEVQVQVQVQVHAVLMHAVQVQVQQVHASGHNIVRNHKIVRLRILTSILLATSMCVQNA